MKPEVSICFRLVPGAEHGLKDRLSVLELIAHLEPRGVLYISILEETHGVKRRKPADPGKYVMLAVISGCFQKPLMIALYYPKIDILRAIHRLPERELRTGIGISIKEGNNVEI